MKPRKEKEERLERFIESRAFQLALSASRKAGEQEDEEMKEQRDAYESAFNALNKLGAVLKEQQGYVVSDKTVESAAALALIAFQSLLYHTALSVRGGADETEGLVASTMHLFNDCLLATIMVVLKASAVLSELKEERGENRPE